MIKRLCDLIVKVLEYLSKIEANLGAKRRLDRQRRVTKRMLRKKNRLEGLR